MPFTPFHMGPGVFIKAILQGSFSLMVFGWTQIVMDLQPLIAMISGAGKLHGFTHTYVGASLIAITAALTGKHLSQWGLRYLSNGGVPKIDIRWWIVFVSAFIGSYTHVILDSIMHADMEPLFPFSASNAMLGVISVSVLHKLCVYSGLVGALIYFVISHGLLRHTTMWGSVRRDHAEN